MSERGVVRAAGGCTCRCTCDAGPASATLTLVGAEPVEPDWDDDQPTVQCRAEWDALRDAEDELARLRAARQRAQVPLASPGARPVGTAPARSVLGGALDALSAALDTVADTGASGSRADVELALRLAERARGLGLRELAEMDALGTHTTAGGPVSSTGGWLARTLHLTEPAARAQVRLATALRDTLPGTGTLLGAGTISLEHARAVHAGVHGLDPAVIADAAGALDALARTADPVLIRRKLRETAISVDDRLAADAHRKAADRAGFTATQVADQTVLGGTLTAEDGATVRTALSLAVERLRQGGDTRGKAARNLAVLLGWARQDLDQHSAGDSLARDVHTVRSHLLIHCTPSQLEQASRPRTGPDTEPRSFADALTRLLELHPDLAPTLTDSATVLSQDSLRRLTCDTTITLIAVPAHAHAHPDSPLNAPDRPAGPIDPLWVGRAARTVTFSQWLALVARDRTCVVKGCGRPAADCIAHHVRHWLDGGPTDLGNLVLLCHQHHHNHHDRGHDLPHHDGDRWLTQLGWRWFTDHGWATSPPNP